MNVVENGCEAVADGDGPERCASCESDPVTVAMVDDELVYGVGSDAVTIPVTQPVHTCAACGMQWTDHVGEDLRQEAVCRHLGVLTPREIIAIREQYGMTRAEFAKVTKLGEATLGRWERGALIQNAANDLFLRLLMNPENMDRLTKAASPVAKTVPKPV